MRSKFILFATQSRKVLPLRPRAFETIIVQESKKRISYPTRYPNQIRLSHLFMVIGISGCFVSATYAKQCCEKGSEERKFWMHIHRLLGYMMTAAIMHRIPYRLLTQAPAHLPGGKWEHIIANLYHLTLYGLMFTIPALGLAGDFYAGKSVSMGGKDLISGSSEPNEAWTKTARKFHRWLGRSLIPISGVHGVAAGYHEYRGHHAIKRITPQLPFFKNLYPKLKTATTQNSYPLGPTVKR